MQTVATAPAPRSARETFRAGNTNINPAPNLDAPRFFVQFGWDVMQADSECVPNKYLLRGEITPLRSFAKKWGIHEIPEAARIPGSEEADPSPSGDKQRLVYAKYWLHAQYEAQRLLDLERGADLQMGLFEVTALAGAPHLYEQLDFNEIFFPSMRLPIDLPATNAEMITYLHDRVPQVVEQSPSDLRPILAEIGAQLIEAAAYAHRTQEQRIEFSHSCMKLSPDDKSGFYKKRYDMLDEESLLRTGKARIHDAIDATAATLKKLSEKDAPAPVDNTLTQILATQQQQTAILQATVDRQTQLIELLLSERAEAKANGKPEPKLKAKNDA